MIWVFLSLERVVELHEEKILQYGGSAGVRDAGLLESAVKRAGNKVAYDPDATVVSVAASLSYGLIKNHAFIDGNKRIGLAALVTFLDLNGHRMVVDQGEQIAAVLRVAASEMTEDEWTAWVERASRPASR